MIAFLLLPLVAIVMLIAAWRWLTFPKIKPPGESPWPHVGHDGDGYGPSDEETISPLPGAKSAPYPWDSMDVPPCPKNPPCADWSKCDPWDCPHDNGGKP